MASASSIRKRRRMAAGTAIVAGLSVLLTTSATRAEEGSNSPGQKGAQVYCFMRAAGNNHEVSWTAAYSLIKRQGDKLFKTSPEHAAVMITEAVVQNPNTFPDCGRYLGDLFQKNAARAAQAEADDDQAPQGPAAIRSGR